jgi:precorrin-2 dehydrogenase/sirohydrochlorin ferrochelatase
VPTAPGYPVQLLLSDAPVLVVGGGAVAARKAAGLIAAGADVTIVAPHVAPDAEALTAQIERRPYSPGEAAGYRLVVTATDDPAVNAAVAADATAAGVFVNSADDPANCTFTLPAIARRGPVTVAVASDGTSPLLSQALRDRFAALLDDDVLALAADLAALRKEIQESGRSTEDVDWRTLLADDPRWQRLIGEVAR